MPAPIFGAAHPELATKLEVVIANADLQFVKRDLVALMADPGMA